MILSSEFNRLAWAVRKKYGTSLKWAMKIAYCLREITTDDAKLWLTKTKSPLRTNWNPTNVMFFVTILRALARKSSDPGFRKEVDSVASDLYHEYSSLRGVGAKKVSTYREGELLYWATLYFVESFIAKKMVDKDNDQSYYVTLELPEGLVTTRLWSGLPS